MVAGLWSRRPLRWFAVFHSFSPPAPGLVITSSFCLETVSSRWYCLPLRPCLPSKLFSVLSSAAATSCCLHQAEGEAAGADKIVAGVVILPTAVFRQDQNRRENINYNSTENNRCFKYWRRSWTVARVLLQNDYFLNYIIKWMFRLNCITQKCDR